MGREFRVQLDGGSLVRDERGQWLPDGWVSPETLKQVREVVRGYHYSPTQGYPGYPITYLIAEATGGLGADVVIEAAGEGVPDGRLRRRAVVPPLPPEVPDAVY